MIRKVVTPGERKISIELPPDFIGKKVEIIAFTIEDAIEGYLMEDNPAATYLASEKTLGNDWLTPEEDKAWQDL